MKSTSTRLVASLSLILEVSLAGWLAAQPVNAQTPPAANPPKPAPFEQLGAVADMQYKGDGLSVIATPDGARLRCVFQHLEGLATPEGLWLRSTAENATGERFSLVATATGREPAHRFNLARNGTVTVAEQTVRFVRPGLTEEYTVSMDGVRQDFVIDEPPAGEGPLRVELEVIGANAEPSVDGARLVLDDSGRKLAYSQPRAVDAAGRELVARLEVLTSNSESRKQKAGMSQVRSPAAALAVVVNDADAAYPVRIDPTFSDADWISMGVLPGADGKVLAAVVDDSGNLFIGGSFIAVGDVIANGVAKWDGTAWSALGSGVGVGGSSDGAEVFVSALAVSGTNLYAGGQFTTAGGTAANYIAKWNGSAWSALGSGMSGGVPPSFARVNALAVSGADLYAGGGFTTAGGVAANRIARWDGNAWSALGSGVGGVESAWSVFALAVSGSDVYAAGYFWSAGGVAATNIAKWNGSAWSALGSGMDRYGEVHALAVSGANLYAGGKFTTAGGVAANRMAKWDGMAWLPLGSGISGSPTGSPSDSAVQALLISGTNLYAGGVFTTAGGTVADYIAKWDGNAWSALGSGMNRWVYALAMSGTDLYAGGQFTTAGGIAANDIAKWNGSAWSAVGSGSKFGLNDCLYVYALAVSGTDLFLGGDFRTAGGVAVNNITKWDGSNWSALGSGVNFNVNALAVSGTNLYAGGGFTMAGGTTANYIAKWNGSAWSALGSGMNGYRSVRALAVSGTDLYAGGTFTTAGGVPAKYIAKWDGTAWSALGLGVNSIVRALAVSGTDLYAGGTFTTADGVPAKYIAKWDGSSWSALSSGMNKDVYALAVSGTDLYAGGDFYVAGGVPAKYIAKWDGSAWSALGSGVELYSGARVQALAVSGTDLYAGGSFRTAGEMTVNHIAKWDGHAWSSLGSGVGGSAAYHHVYALAVSGSDLYAGGGFTTAGDKVSAHIARANFSGNSIAGGGRFGTLAYLPATGFTCTFSDATVGQPYRIQASPTLANGTWNDFTNFTYTGPVVITDTSTITAPGKFYRAVTP